MIDRLVGRKSVAPSAVCLDVPAAEGATLFRPTPPPAPDDPTETRPIKAMGFFYGFAVALIWGAQPVIAMFGYRASMTAPGLTLLRFAASGLLMLPFFIKRGVGNACGIAWPRAIALALLAGPLYNLVL